MHKNQIDIESNDKELIDYVLELLYEASARSERVLRTLDEMIANSKDLDTNKP